MATIPTPDVAKGINVGAKQGRSRKEFHSGPFLNVNEYPSVTDAMQDSANGNGAAYIPKGTTINLGDQVWVDSSLNGATLVGDGAGSVLRAGDWVGIYLQDKSSPIRDVTIANLRVNANSRKFGINKIDNGYHDDNLLFDNVWVHDANKAGFRVDGPGLTLRNVSAWGSNEYHGIGGWNNPPNDSPRSKLVRCLAWNNTGYGIDASEGSWLIDRCLVTQNGESGKSGGMKTSTNTNHTTIKNTVSINNKHKGFQTTGRAQNLEIDNFLVRDNPRHGVILSYESNVNVGRMYVVNSGYHNVVMRRNASIDATRIDTCDAGYCGIEVQSGSGSIETVVESGNANGINSGGVDIATINNTSNDIPTVEEIIGQDSASVHYHDGNGWQDATMKYYNGQQFTDTSVNQIQ